MVSEVSQNQQGILLHQLLVRCKLYAVSFSFLSEVLNKHFGTPQHKQLLTIQLPPLMHLTTFSIVSLMNLQQFRSLTIGYQIFSMLAASDYTRMPDFGQTRMLLCHLQCRDQFKGILSQETHPHGGLEKTV